MQYSFQHCKPAVDDDTFQKMVERQYEMLRKERMKGLEEQKARLEESGAELQTAPAAPLPNEDSQPPPQQEVSSDCCWKGLIFIVV